MHGLLPARSVLTPTALALCLRAPPLPSLKFGEVVAEADRRTLIPSACQALVLAVEVAPTAR